MDIKTAMIQARFWNQVTVISHSNSDQCWLWKGAKMPNGYGIFGHAPGKTCLAHRYAASLCGDIADKVVMHRCDNPSCVRPDHLEIGDQSMNQRDMYVKARDNNKLNAASVKDIRSRRVSRREYAALYGVSVFTVGQVQRRETWDWVT